MALRRVGGKFLKRFCSDDSKFIDGNIILRSIEDVESFLKLVLDSKKIDQNGQLPPPPVVLQEVEGVWISDCRRIISGTSEDPVFDERFHALREYFAQAETLGLDVAALDLFHGVMSLKPSDPRPEPWPGRIPKSVVFSGNANDFMKKESWDSLMTPWLAQIFWSGVTHLTIWTCIQVPNVPKNHAAIPEWLKLVPLEHMRALTHFAFTLIGSKNNNTQLPLLVLVLADKRHAAGPGDSFSNQVSAFKAWTSRQTLDLFFKWTVWVPIQSGTSRYWEEAFLRREHYGIWQNPVRDLELDSQADVKRFIESALHPKKTDNGSQLPPLSPFEVDSIWVSEFRDDLPSVSRLPSYDKEFISVREYFAGAETLGFEVAAFEFINSVVLPRQVGGTPVLESWRPKSVVFAGDVDKQLTKINWQRLTLPLAQRFWSSVTQLTIWTSIQIPNREEYHAEIPEWVTRVPFKEMINLTHFSFTLIGSKRNRTRLPLMVLILPGAAGSPYFPTVATPSLFEVGIKAGLETLQKFGWIEWLPFQSDTSKVWKNAFIRREQYIIRQNPDPENRKQTEAEWTGLTHPFRSQDSQ